MRERGGSGFGNLSASDPCKSCVADASPRLLVAVAVSAAVAHLALPREEAAGEQAGTTRIRPLSLEMRGKRDDGYAKGMMMDGGRVSQELEMPQQTGSRGTTASGPSFSAINPSIARDLLLTRWSAGEDGVPYSPKSTAGAVWA